MTLQEFYSQINGNYDDALKRLMNDRLIDKFIKKFPNDQTMQELKSAVENNDIETSFRAAHTLKGVAANLSFSALQAAASNLTEQLRSRTEQADKDLYEEVKKEYAIVIDTLNNYINQ